MIPRSQKVYYNIRKPAVSRKEKVNKAKFKNILEEETRKREERYSDRDKK